jgi:ABC-type lipoprotein export system ATPase subunit
LLLDYQKESRTTLVLVTHSINIAKMADRMIFLQDGRITSG